MGKTIQSIAGAMLIAAAAFLVAATTAQAPAAAPAPATSTTAAAAPAPAITTGAPAPAAMTGGLGPSAATGAPGPAGMDCLTYLVNMSDCLTYVEAGSNLTTPDKGCCPELAGLVESQPICLCQLLGTNTSDSLGVQINFQKALKLPSVCRVETPPVSLCSAAGYPVGVPMPSEAPSPSGGGTSTEAGTSKSGASGIASVSQLLGFAVACLATLVIVF